MTEDEAKTKWCPVANTRLILSVSGASDRCIGSACMAWRTDVRRHVSPLTESNELRKTASANKWVSKTTAYTFEADEPRHYCGLAGNPFK